jgi:hypothetical protein
MLHLWIIIDALRRALDQLVTEHGEALAAREENELNALLQARLNSLCAQERILSQMVACVVRGGETLSFDGKRLELRPDLGIHLTGRHRNFPLVVECKIIDATSRKGVDLYCANGIRRFVEGEYAWASSQGVMLAYVRDGSSLTGALRPHLKLSAALDHDPLRTEVMPRKARGASSPVWTSRHGRDFDYVDGASGLPGPIGISHLWFNLPKAAVAIQSFREPSLP